jgi:dihydroxyacetone kinase
MMELAVVARRAVENLEGLGLRVERVYAGTFLSALEMAGVSLSVLRLDNPRLARLDAPTDAPAWPNPGAVARPRCRGRVRVTTAQSLPAAAPEAAATPSQAFAQMRARQLPKTTMERGFESAIEAVARVLIASAEHLNELDRAVGDGDLGLSLTRGAEALRAAVPGMPLFDPSLALHTIGLTLQESIAGTSGPLYAVFFLRAAAHLRADPDRSLVDPVFWAEAFRAGCNGVIELGGAGRGDRTMLDALMPACDAFTSAVENGAVVPDALAAAADSAGYGAAETAGMTPRRGRSSYLGRRAVGHPDPGASAVALWLRAVAEALAGAAD